MSKAKDWGTPSDAAKFLGVARRTVAKELPRLQELGAAQQAANGRWTVMLEGLDLAWKLIRPGSPVGASPPAEVGAGDGDAGEIPPQHVSRARREFYLAEMAQMKAQRCQGQLVEAEPMGRAMFERVRMFRDRLQAMPARWAAEVVGMESVAQIEIVLEQSVQEFLEDVADPVRGIAASVPQEVERQRRELEEQDG